MSYGGHPFFQVPFLVFEQMESPEKWEDPIRVFTSMLHLATQHEWRIIEEVMHRAHSIIIATEIDK